QLPARNHASIPNFVNYRLGVQSVCDSSLVMSWNSLSSELAERLITYPTPVYDEVNLQLWDKDKNIRTISISDIQGKIIRLETKQESTYKHKLNVTELAAGIYLVKVEDQNGKTYTGKMVKN
ncbi:MAG: T9SS type A sorting domain-containing protein, partial [Saprospiraceae bacterium]